VAVTSTGTGTKYKEILERNQRRNHITMLIKF
jgi:hypothetical protein